MGQVCIGMGIRMIKFFMRTITEEEIEKKKKQTDVHLMAPGK